MHRCALCHSEKNLRSCESCDSPVCRDCITHLEPERFRFHPTPPKLWRKKHFCLNCFEEKVAPELAHYDEMVEKSEEITIVSKAFRGQVPCIKRMQEPSHVKDHLDLKEAVAHLKFLAAWEGFDAVVGVENFSTKVRRHGYQHMEWKVVGHFAHLDRRRFRPD